MDKNKKPINPEELKALINLMGDSNGKIVILSDGQLSIEKKHVKKIRMY